MTLVSEARVSARTPQHYIDALCEHFAEHEITVTRQGGAGHARFNEGWASLQADGEAIVIRAEAPDHEDLASLKYFLASHLGELAEAERFDILWDGDGTRVAELPGFRVMEVVGIRDLSPRMRRITLKGENLARFGSDRDLHVKFLIPPEGIEPQWPHLGQDGIVHWPAEDRRPEVRKYTIRRFDRAASQIEIDFALHGAAGPGSRWALRAAPGDICAIMGPGGLSIREADWYLLAGDETALPAIARLLEALPATARGKALIEVDRPGDYEELTHPEGVEVRWLYRNGAAPGTSTALQDSVIATAIPKDTAVFAWAGVEFAAFRAIRSHWRKTCGLSRDQHLCVAYWRRDKPQA